MTDTSKHDEIGARSSLHDIVHSLHPEDVGNVAKLVAAHESMVIRYYNDVLYQANQSFASAKLVAWLGFLVLILTGVYATLYQTLTTHPVDPKLAGMGLGAGTLIEFISGVNFWLYDRASKQFNAFHVCLERTHRYLIAYSVAATMNDEVEKEETKKRLVWIIANAPIITTDGLDNKNKKLARDASELPHLAKDSSTVKPTLSEAVVSTNKE